MSQPIIVDDGNFSVALQNGPWRYKFPFADKGDFVSFVAIRDVRQSSDSFSPPVPMASRTFANQKSATGTIIDDCGNLIPASISSPGTAYLATFSDPTEAGNCILEWTEQWASIPVPRIEYGSVSYTQSVPLNRGNSGEPSDFFYGSVNYGNVTSILDGKFVFEYSLTAPPKTLHAPRFAKVTGDHTFLFGSVRDILARTGYILADDSEGGIYMGGIYYRKSTFALRSRPRQIS